MEARRKEVTQGYTIRKIYFLQGLDCAHCAAKIERELQGLDGIAGAKLEFVTGKMTVEIEEPDRLEEIIKRVVTVVTNIEPGIKVEEAENNPFKPAVNLEIVPDKKHERESDRMPIQEESKLFKLKVGLKATPRAALIVGVGIFLFVLIFNLSFWAELVFYLASYVLIGGEVIFKALRNIVRGQVFDENFLMFIATIGALAIGEWPEAVAVMLFYQIGEYFQNKAVNHSRQSIKELMNIRPDYANLLEGERERRVSPEEVAVGQIIIIKPGEKVPLDGIVLEGSSVMDTSNLTGEFVPRSVAAGSTILAGFINHTGVLKVEVSKCYEQSTVAKILDLVENASSQKAPTENFITKFARVYTPAVVLAATLLAVIPPLLIAEATFNEWLRRALVFLVVSCPCALVISIPLSFFGGIGGASRQGILIKGSNYLEALNSVRTMVFDKTGTLTEGVFEVTSISPHGKMSREELLETAALAESYSSHPIAVSILKAYGREPDKSKISEYQEIPGRGVRVVLQGKTILVGSSSYLQGENISLKKVQENGTIVHVAVEGEYAGYLAIADRVRSDTPQALQGLRKIGIKQIIMLTGDHKQTGERIGQELGFDQVYAELLPDQKVVVLEEIEKRQKAGSKVAYIGDGINDAPVLARADIGIAMGGLGSDAAIEAADIVLMTDEPSKIVGAVRIAKKTRSIVWQNIILALGVKTGVLFLGALGAATMWEAVFADVGVALIAVLNALRVLRVEYPELLPSNES
ncbi:MAG TPA: cadmium-translocating P-type ATPase [Peptococcaceae bacterium]|nr:cadmium-translocating P-type ATPase [Peptococcaceae bacterium]